MKYKFLLKALHLLIGIKRFVWWTGSMIYRILAKITSFFWRFLAFWAYKIEYYLRRTGLGKDQIWWLKRDNLQIILLAVLFISALPQTKLYSQELTAHPGQQSIAYRLFGPGENFDYEVIEAEEQAITSTAAPVWRAGSVESGLAANTQPTDYVYDADIGTIAIHGGAVTKPSIIPGVIIIGVERKSIIDYIIEPGDSLSSIAYKYGVSVSTLLWENNLSLTSIIRPGDKLRILPTTGLMHTIKKGDTLKKIASSYSAEIEDIIKFNNLKEDGTDLIIGERIMVPNGVKAAPVVARAPTTAAQTRYTGSAPASSAQTPTISGYVWPSSAKMITQYFGWRHYGLDIAGPKNSAIYAARSGKVAVSQCGWNSGYGCYIIIDHGNGIRTLYGHNNQLLVNVGDQVTTGQTISLMGNTGKVYGVTGIHLHFEIQVNGTKVNPLKYVK
jgi:LysM repeat protein